MKVIEGGAKLAKKLYLSNYDLKTVPGPDGKSRDVKIAKRADQIALHFLKMSGAFPKRVGARLFIIGDKNEIIWIDSSPKLFAEISGRFEIRVAWGHIEGAVSKNEFFEFLKGKVERYEMVSTMPHFPERKEIFYALPKEIKAIQTNKKSAFDGLIDFYSPATPQDRALIKAAHMTPLWGGDGGERPAFFVESDEKTSNDDGRGHGKSTFVQLIGYLFNGGVKDCNFDDGDEIQKKIINAQNEVRMGLFDNLKANRVSSGNVEKIVTSDYIDGHKMYVGGVRVPNIFTYFVTINDAALSKDFAQRSVRIMLAQPRYDAWWKNQVKTYIDKHRWEIFEEIIGIIQAEKPYEGTYFRFPLWQRDVLNKTSMDPEGLIKFVLTRQKDVDDDDKTGKEIDEHIAFKLNGFKLKGYGSNFGPTDADADRDTFIIANQVVTEWIREFKDNRKMSPHACTKLAKRLSKKMDQVHFRWGRAWVWNRNSDNNGGYVVRTNQPREWIEYRHYSKNESR